MGDEGSGWPAEIAKVLGEMDATHDMIENLELQNGERGPHSVQKVKRMNNIMRKMHSLKLYTSDQATSERDVSLVENEVAQRNFVHGCLTSIKSVNFNMQLEVLRKGLI